MVASCGLTLPSSGPAYGRPLKSNVRRRKKPSIAMHKVLHAGQALLSLSPQELCALSKLVSNACSSSQYSDTEFMAAYGISREAMVQILEALSAELHNSRQASEVVDVWADRSSVMVRVITAFGDPVEMGESEAGQFAEQLQQAIREAS